jgi:hypothetical protein
MRWQYEFLFFGDSVWTDFSILIDSRATTIERNGCSNDLSSSIDVCQFTLKYATTAKKALHNHVMGRLMIAKLAKEPVLFRCTNRTTYTSIFFGRMDLGNLSQTNKRDPGWLTLEAEDNSWRLEAEMDDAFEFPSIIGDTPYYVFNSSAKNRSIVHILAARAGYLAVEIDDLGSDPVLLQIQHISYNLQSKRSYRNFLDQLLFECGAVYSFTSDGKLQVRSLIVPPGRTADSILGSTYFVGNGIQTKTGDRQEDGVEITWADLSAMRAKVFSANISLSRDDAGEIIGEEIPPKTYYPATGDIEEVYQDFSASWLDRPYFTKNSRLENKDLSLITVHNPTLEAIRDSQIVLVAPTIFESLRARILFQNTEAEESRFLKSFDILGDCLYRSKINSSIVPVTAGKPKKHTTEFVFNTKHAHMLANHLRLFYAFGDVQHSWKQKGAPPMFSIVNVSPSNSAISSLAMVIRIKESFSGDGNIFSEVTAVGISIFNSEPTRIRSVVNGKGASGEIGPRGVEGRSYRTEIDSSNGDVFKPGESMTTTLVGKVYLNEKEITGDLPDTAFVWKRTSYYSRLPPDDDYSWNLSHASGYRQVTVLADSIQSRATYSLEIHF